MFDEHTMFDGPPDAVRAMFVVLPVGVQAMFVDGVNYALPSVHQHFVTPIGVQTVFLVPPDDVQIMFAVTYDATDSVR